MQFDRRTFLKQTGIAAGGVLAASGAATAQTQPSYTTGSDLTETLGVSGGALDDAIQEVSPGSPLVGLGSVWADVASTRGINELYMVAHAALESNWGRSNFARNRNNLYGWQAYTGDPGEAKYFSSKAACIQFVMERVDELYLTPGGTYYNGPTLSGMNENYATDPSWADKIATIMNKLAGELDTSRPPAFESGTNVVTTGAVNVRTSPAVGDNVTVTAPSETTGSVREGPERADGFIWWKVAYDNGVTGWSVQRYLNEHAGDGGEFDVGTRVATTVDLSVRSGASIGFGRKDVVSEGGAGYIRDGPIERDGYTWWKVGYNAGVEGWSVERYLEAAPRQTGKFETDQRVQTTVDLSVRADAALDANRKDVVDDGSAGYIRGGPVDADGYTWWKVGYNAGVEGWSVEQYLEDAPTNPGKFDIGDDVATTSGLNVRADAGTDASEEGTVADGATGVVRDGPVDADGYTWWKIEYDGGPTGWCADGWLVEQDGGPDFIWPTTGDISSDFYDPRPGRKYHRAIDIAAPRGRTVVAAADGTVSAVADLPNGGKSVFVEHENGYETAYMHLSAYETDEGVAVSAGDVIGRVGSTGRSTGPHLHMQVEQSGDLTFIPGDRGDFVEQGEGIPRDYEGM